MEQLTTFVSSRGILRSCGAHNRAPVSSQARLDADLLERHRPGGAIYVCTDALRDFALRCLPLLTSPFTLVSGDSDVPVDESLLADDGIRRLLDSGWLSAWYAQNLATRHPKLHALPIGLDYHTMWERPGFWGLTPVSAIAQENALINTWSASPEFPQRYLAAYCNWHFAMQRGDRQACFDAIDRQACFFEPSAVPRQSAWSRQAECMFVVSPEGAGMDCHRTWEALLLGCIPILKRSPLTELFDRLPAMIVDDWREVTRDALLGFARELPERRFDFSPLFRAYWVSAIGGVTESLVPPSTQAEFRRLVTRKTG